MPLAVPPLEEMLLKFRLFAPISELTTFNAAPVPDAAIVLAVPVTITELPPPVTLKAGALDDDVSVTPPVKSIVAPVLLFSRMHSVVPALALCVKGPENVVVPPVAFSISIMRGAALREIDPM